MLAANKLDDVRSSSEDGSGSDDDVKNNGNFKNGSATH